MKKVLLILAIYILATIACSTTPLENEQPRSRCPDLPDEFKESDLTGTWVAEYGAATDVLTLREDGSYKQVYHRFSDDFSYESEWNEWWLEDIKNGISYLHLENMRRCDHSDVLCEKEGGGGVSAYWDFCTGRGVRMLNEVVLIVTGVPERDMPASNGIWLWHMPSDIDSGSYHFELKP